MNDGQLVAAGSFGGMLLLGQFVLSLRKKLSGARPRDRPGRLNFAGGVLDWPMLQTSVLMTGQTGSGKSSAAAVLMRELLESGCGAYCPSAKPDDLPKLLKLCERAGRKDVTVVGRDAKARVNFLEDLLLPEGDTATQAMMLASGFDQITQVLSRGGSGWGDDAKYWQSGYERLLRTLLQLTLLAGVIPTVRGLLETLQSCPRNRAAVGSDAFKGTRCDQLLRCAFLNSQSMPGLKADFDQVSAYVTGELPDMPEKSRGSFEAMILGPSDVLSKGLCNKILAADDPTLDLGKAVAENRIILTEFSFGRDREAAIAINTAIKYLIQLRILARSVIDQTKPFVLFLDEFSQTTSSFDVEYLPLQRSSKGPLIAAVQGTEFLKVRNPGQAGEAAVETLLGNFGVKIGAGPQTPATSRWYCDLVGQRLGVTASGSSQSCYQNPMDVLTGGREGHASGGFSESLLPLLTPSDLAALRSGGPANGRTVDLLVYGGRYGQEAFTFASVKQE